MKRLIEQIFKFAIVGGISFVVDFLIYTLLCNVLGVHYQIAGVSGFVIALIVNYSLSMRFVFASKDDMSKRKEFIIFAVLSIIGAGLNALILYLCVDIAYVGMPVLQENISEKWMNIVAKVVATAIVMVYNFVTRKIFLEKKEES